MGITYFIKCYVNNFKSVVILKNKHSYEIRVGEY